MAEVKLTTNCVSQKINKIRWKPKPSQSLEASNTFVTGSWDDEVNKVSVWSVEDTNLNDSSLYHGATIDPKLICDVKHSGDVTDLQYVSSDHIIASSSRGTVTLYRHHRSTQTIGEAQHWDRVHHLGTDSCPCTCLASRGDELIVTGGEDGCICVLNIGQKQPVRQNDTADSCTINSIIFLKQLEILTVNSRGQLKIFDLREKTDEPSKLFSVSDDHTPFHCVDKHPNQPHIVAVGTADGSLCIWDLRQENRPLSVLSAHSSSLWEAKFHPHNSNHLFTCSEDGSLWHWDVSAIHTPASVSAPIIGTGAGAGGGTLSGKYFSASGASTNSNPWLSLEVSQQHLNIISLANSTLALNSIDIEDQILLCGTDNESILTISLPQLR